MNLKNEFLVLLGATVGGIVGLVAFEWLLGQNFYALLLPGGLLGMGAGMFKGTSKAVAAICGILAIALGFVAEWNSFPFKTDGSLGYFVLHFYELKPLTLIMIALGGAIGFWIPFRRRAELIDNSNPNAR